MRNSLTLAKSSSHSEVYSNFSFFLMAVKKRKPFLTVHERKRDRESIRPVSCFTSFIIVGLLISKKFVTFPIGFNPSLCQHKTKEFPYLYSERALGGV